MMNASVSQHEDRRRILKLVGGFTLENVKAIDRLDFDTLLLSYGDWLDFNEVKPLSHKVTDLIIRASANFALHELKAFKKLKRLTVDLAQDAIHSGKLDLSDFELLEVGWFVWNKNYSNLFEVITLKKLTLVSFKEKDFQQIKSLKKIEELELHGGSFTNLEGIGDLQKLSKINLQQITKLSNIEELEKLASSLELLKIDRCNKVDNFSFLSKMQNLRELIIATKNDVDLSGIYQLNHLERLIIKQPPVIDLRKLLSMPKLSYVELILASSFEYNEDDLTMIASELSVYIDLVIRGKGKKKYVVLSITK